MKFTKMQGIGNDYVYVDCTREIPENLPELSRRISDRHFGIGSDGLVLILPGGDGYDFEMRMFNADGSESEMCGNASRCVGKYVYERGLTDRTAIRLKTGGGIRLLELREEKGRIASVRVDMGLPLLARERIPTGMVSNTRIDGEDAVIAGPLEVDGKTFPATALNTGNPHCVIFVEDAENWDVALWGPKIENHPMFPLRTNVEFATVLGPDRIRMRVWERGSGETMACGTGASATLVAASLNGLTGRRAELILNGGTLEIEWDEKTGHVFMTGPAEFVFDGEWPESLG